MMQTFTKIEIGWISYMLRETSQKIKEEIGDDATATWMMPMLNLRAEQYASLAKRLDKALCDGDKRIAIEY